MVRPRSYGNSASTSADRQSALRSKEDRKRVDGYVSQEAYGLLKQYADTNGMSLSTAMESLIWEANGGKETISSYSCAAKQEESPRSFSFAVNSLSECVAPTAVTTSAEKAPDVSSFFERRKREILKGE